MIQFDHQICRDFAAAIQKEWLETNGIGGYASSSIVGANTRRYHGLLVAATQPPVGRRVLLSKLEETVCIGDEHYELSCNQYPGIVHPQGYKFLQAFTPSPLPTWEYAIQDIVLEKLLWMVNGQNTTVLTYTLRAGAPIQLCLRPLIAGRDHHSLHYENAGIQTHVEAIDGNTVQIVPYDSPSTLYLHSSVGEFQSDSACWYKNFEYPVEAARGFDAHEDLYSPGEWVVQLESGETVAIIASTEPPNEEWESMRNVEIDRRKGIVHRALHNRGDGSTRKGDVPGGKDDFLETLTLAADQFLIQRGEERHSIIAGYHWFTDWGRDAMIALPGLTLVTGRYEIAQGILRAFAQHCDQGMLPNRFPDVADEPEYNTVDATLWFFYAVAKYLEYTDDLDFIRDELWETLVDIIQWHLRGTRYNIRMGTDSLISAGMEGVQLTWMDAKIGDWVVTPRHGKPVEINALWYNALKVMEGLIQRLGDAGASTEYAKLARTAQVNFNERFWNAEANCLYDCIDGEMPDASIRPNQIFAISLPHSVLSEERHRPVLDVVTRDLLTPVGLRSLSPNDEQYVGYYGGDPYHRDSAYHQGTVWGWLIGPFVTAYMKVNGKTSQSREAAKQFLAAFGGHLKEAGVGSISEIFDGDKPHTPRGCIAQAWSIAEVLRAYAEDAMREP
ncbi:MAG: glycogen debranching enzyme N-terminal domain-containing protein [Candidatus Poribacteria bacterium]|nr:glycogen debranching enzyme N-terminal domain-containing protein [Candidatus Poribacteria bacterium]